MNSEYLGKEFKKLGFGLMRLPMINDDVDIEQVKEMVDLYMKKGFTYFDTSPLYIMGKSESAAREVIIKRYPRDRFEIATKLPMWKINEESDMEKTFNISMKSLGTDYIDFYLLHGLSASFSDRFVTSIASKADKFNAWEFIRQKKAEGKVKHIGFSFHDTSDVLDKLLTEHPETEFVQLQINYADWEDELIQSRRCYETAMKHNVPVIVMEPVKGGVLANLRPDVKRVLEATKPDDSLASWAIRYAASLEGIITVLSGMSNIDQLKDNISYMSDFQPISKEEEAVIKDAVNVLKETDSIKCTDCRYCIEGCPKKISIPSIFTIVNDYYVYRNSDYSKTRYSSTVKSGGTASDCVKCGSCESHCPQKLRIINHLKEVADFFE